MEELKPWWTSKAIWTGLIGSAWGVAGTLGLLPEGLSQTDVLTVVLAITGIGGVVFRKTARARIGSWGVAQDADARIGESGLIKLNEPPVNPWRFTSAAQSGP